MEAAVGSIAVSSVFVSIFPKLMAASMGGVDVGLLFGGAISDDAVVMVSPLQLFLLETPQRLTASRCLYPPALIRPTWFWSTVLKSFGHCRLPS